MFHGIHVKIKENIRTCDVMELEGVQSHQRTSSLSSCNCEIVNYCGYMAFIFPVGDRREWGLLHAAELLG